MPKLDVNPVLIRMQESAKRSIYQSIVAMGFRARQINDDIKNELKDRMADVITDTEETDDPNFDQISISREFDKLPKPTFLAMKEIENNKINFEVPEPEKED